MGWFSTSSASDEASSSKPPSPISRESRQACWTARDAFFQCLNVNGIEIPPMTGPPTTTGPNDGPSGGEGKGGPCEKLMKEYETACARSWVEYFNKRRVLEIRQRRTIEAAEKERDAKMREAK